MAKDLSVKLVINGEDRTSGAFSKTRAGVESISQGLDRLQTRFNQILTFKGFDIITRQVGEIVKTADSYKTFDARLKLVTLKVCGRIWQLEL